MRTIFKIILALFLPLSIFAGESELIKLRSLLYKASLDNDNAKIFFEHLNSSPDITSSMLTGYQGMAYMIKAKHSWNPYNKFSYFSKGRDLLDKAIENDPSNVELRWLRFCTQTNAPGFLGYNGEIKEDKAVVLYGYSLIKEGDLKDRIKKYMDNPKYCTLKERSLL